MNFGDLSDDQKAKAKECRTPEELMSLAQEEGVELTDAQLEAVAGGWNSGCGDACYTMDYLHKQKPAR